MTLDAQTVQTILILATVVLTGWAVFKSYQLVGKLDLTPPALLEAVTEARPVAVELMEITQVAVNSIEQLRREGKITDNDVAFNRALDLIKKWIPDEWEVDNEDIISSINAAVLVASTLREQAGASSENVTNTR